MVVEPTRAGSAVAVLAEAAARLGEAQTLEAALELVAEAVAHAVEADVAVVRVRDPGTETLRAVAVAAASSVARAELAGSRYPVEELPADEVDEFENLPGTVRRAAERMRTTAVLQLPIRDSGGAVASLELLRGTPFGDEERALARLAAAQAALALRAHVADGAPSAIVDAGAALALAGDALAAGADVAGTAEHVTRLAAEVTGAVAALLWRENEDGGAELVAIHGPVDDELIARAPESQPGVSVEEVPGGSVATLQLGQPALGSLQLVFRGETPPGSELRTRLSTFGVRAAHALRSSGRSRTVALELERTRALLEVVGQAIAQLSLAHTLQTAVDRIAELLGTDAVAVYLSGKGRLRAAADRGITGPHALVAERLLELVLGPFRGRGILTLHGAAADPRLAGVDDAVLESGIEDALAVPLLVAGDPIGLLAVYPRRGRTLTENEAALLLSLASQLAVAVQNAQLHEQAKQLNEDRKLALEAEQRSARQLRALYEISGSFARSLSLERTLEAVARTIVEQLELDAAVIRMPDERGATLVPKALHVAESRLTDAVGAILSRAQPIARLPGRRLFRMGRALVLDAETARRLGASYELLVPFLEKGSTAAVVPVATPAEVLGTLTLLSLDPARPLDESTIEAALSIAGQAALAIDNARLYQQQKEFADTMQRSLLPRTRPLLEGLELGAVYESSARVDVGGDVYDFLELDDGRLAVVLGDVTGHGIDAAADMAMAKFVFRSLAREHPEPGDFLAAANEVVVGEIAAGKFITMAYVVADGLSGEVAGASGGHPAPRVVGADGSVRELAATGLALGIDQGQLYDEVREPFDRGASVVLYTDGVVEARRDGELYGLERLDAVLAGNARRAPDELAAAVVEECRVFAGGELADDCAVVVIRRT